MKYFIVLLVFMYVANAGAVTDTNVPGALTTQTSSSLSATDSEKIQMIATLENDLTILDSEIKKCEKNKKGWIAATVVGSAGVVATGIAAGVQGAKLADKKEELNKHNADIQTKTTTLNDLKNKTTNK